jgi:hypothetical protein
MENDLSFGADFWYASLLDKIRKTTSIFVEDGNPLNILVIGKHV